jgi:hypothetical protein
MLRSYGTELGSNDKVHYSVELKNSSGEIRTFQSDGVGNNVVNINLGSMKTGNYIVTAKAHSGKYNDAIQKKIKVADSILETAGTNYYKLRDGLKINGGTITALTFYNDSSSLFYDTLNNLRYSFGERVDQLLARKLSREMIKMYYNQDDYYSIYDEEEKYDFSGYQNYDGGITLLTYDGSDPVLTAEICSVAPQCFDKNAIIGYFTAILDNKASTPEEVAASYWGLAALKQPVLTDIRNLISNTKSLEMKEKLYLGIALSYLGDTNGAEDIFTNAVVPKIKKAGRSAYLDSGSIENTALASILAIKTGNQVGAALMEYVLANPSEEVLTNLEQLIYISTCVPTVIQQGSFTYLLNGKTVKVTLDKTDVYNITLKAKDINNIKFTNVSGDVGVSVVFTGPAGNFMKKDSKLIDLQRYYMWSGNTLRQSDYISINLDPDFSQNAPDGWYEVTDIMPAGFRFVSALDDYSDNWYFNCQEGQKVTFTYHYEKGKAYQKIIYTARAVSTGEFTADNAFILDTSSNAYGIAERQKITIKE